MTRLRYPITAVVVAVWCFLSVPSAAYGAVCGGCLVSTGGGLYIDPGTGSIIIQALIGVLVGGIAMMGIYRVRVKNFLINMFSRRRVDEESEEGEPAE